MKLFKYIFGNSARAVSLALRQGLSPSEIAWSLAFGVIVGIFPIYGVTTSMLGLLGHAKKWNHLLLQSANWLVLPLKLLLILPHIRLGEFLLRAANPFHLSLSEFTLRFQEAPMDTLRAFAMTFLHAAFAWLAHAPFSILLVYLLARMLLPRTPPEAYRPEAHHPGAPEPERLPS